jgi:hypothetical protein
MGIFDRLRDMVADPTARPMRGSDALKPIGLPGGRTIEVVGESHYQDALDEVCGGKCEDGYQLLCQAELRPEPHNEYDKNAVGVYVEGRKVGHLTRPEAKRLQPRLLSLRKQGRLPQCGALITGGWYRGPADEGHYGIRLDLDW